MIVLCSLIIVLLLLYLWVQRKFYRLSWKIKGPVIVPSLGKLGMVSPENIFSIISKYQKAYNSPVAGWYGPCFFLYVSDPVSAERILTAPECVNKTIFYDNITHYLGSGLITNNNPEWSVHRKLINPVFKTSNLRQFLPIFNDKTKELCEKLKEFSQLEQPVDIKNTLHVTSLSITSETMMGRKSGLLGEKLNVLVKSYNTLLESSAKTCLNPLYRISVISKLFDNDRHKNNQDARQNINEFIKESIEVNSGRVSDPTAESPTFISHMMELNRTGLLSTSELMAESFHLIAASFETTSIAWHHIITLLAMHPEWQDKLYQDISERFPDKDVELTADNIQDTPLIDIVIKEALRLFPVIPLKGKLTSADFALSDGVVLPKGTNIVMDVYSMQTDPKYWGADASEFNPYRFLHESERHPYVYVPFSKGVRTCIGTKYANFALKVFVIKVFQRFRFTTTLKLNEIKFIYNVTNKMDPQPLFKIKERIREVSN